MAKKQEAKEPKYDTQTVIKLWERGMRPSEIQQSDKPGVKGISSAFVSRILFGTTYDDGQTADQKARHKVELDRRKKRQDARDKKAVK